MNKYGSHVPLLHFIGKTFDIKLIVEFGLGKFSTPIFLNKDIFPSVEKLHSYETSKSWIRKIRKTFSDSRHSITKISKEKDKLFNHKYPMDIDLIFIDGESSHRVPCLNHFANTAKMLIIHDYPKRRYKPKDRTPRRSVKRLKIGKEVKYKHICVPPDYFAPCTTLFSNAIGFNSIKWKIKWN